MPNNAEFLHQMMQASRPRPSADRSFSEFLEQELENLYRRATYNGNSTWSTGLAEYQVSANNPWTIVRGPY